MDRLTVYGLIIAIAAIFAGQILEGGSVDALFDWAAFIIVVGGSAGAVMVQSHGHTFTKALKIFLWIFRPPNTQIEEEIARLAEWSNKARREGLLGLEKNVEDGLDPFINKGLLLLIDGNNSQAIRDAMYIELDVEDKNLLQAAKVFESMGGYSPTLGIVGAVLGLIHVMGNLSNPALLGSGIATAFVATIYGVGFANLLYIPVYHKLRAIIAQQSQYREMVIEGLSCIAEGQNPRLIEIKLQGFVSH